MGIKIKAFPANHGDSFLIIVEEDSKIQNILVDGGTGRQSYRQLKEEFNSIKENGQFIDLLIITHCDDDHIKGILDIFQDSKIDKNIIKEVWFNSGSLISERLEEEYNKNDREIPLVINNSREKSIKQGITLEKELETLNCWSKTLVMSYLEKFLGNTKITVLSPDLKGLQKLNKSWEYEQDRVREMTSTNRDYSTPMKELLKNEFQEDQRIPNGSSIAFLLEHKDFKILMLGDSHPSVVELALKKLGYSASKKLKVDMFKVSHHGSKHNTSSSLLNIVDCENFLISTNGRRHGLPNKECLARIVSSNENKCVNLYFNYYLNNIFLKSDFEEYYFKCHYLSENRYIFELGE